MTRFTVFWQAIWPAASLKVNPLPTDRRPVLCAGWTPITAESALDARRQYERDFPQDTVVDVR